MILGENKGKDPSLVEEMGVHCVDLLFRVLLNVQSNFVGKKGVMRDLDLMFVHFLYSI